MTTTKEKNSKRSPYIDLETIGEYICDKLGIRPEDVLELELNSGRYDTKQILLRPEVDSERYVIGFPDIFKVYEVTVTKLTVNKTKVYLNMSPQKSLMKKL